MTVPQNSSDIPDIPRRTIGALLEDQVRARGHAPAVTYYGDDTGERTELSYATFHNWSSKTANLLADRMGAARAARIAVTVVDHWIGAVVVTAAWQLGAVAAVTRDLDGVADADVVCVNQSAVAGAGVDEARLLVVGDGFGGRVTLPTPGVPFGDEVLAFADDYDDPAVGLDDPALLTVDTTLTQAQLLHHDWGRLRQGDRLLATATLDRLATGWAAVLAAGASLVWTPRADAEAAQDRLSAERVTHALGDDGAIRPV